MRVTRSMAAILAVLVLGVASTLTARPASAAQDVPTGQAAVVVVDSLVVRAAPGLGAAQVVSLTYGATVSVIDGPVVADGYDWFLLEQGGTVLGWSVEGIRQPDGSYVDPVLPRVAVATTVWTVTSGFLPIRASAADDATVVRIVTFGTRLTQTGDSVEVGGARWYPVEGGWVGGETGTESAALFPERYPLFVSADVLNVRAGPGLEESVVRTLVYGDAVNIFDTVRDADGTDWNAVNEDGTLWVAAEYLTVSLDEAVRDVELAEAPLG